MATARSGYTLLELVIVVTIIGILLAIAIPRTQLVLDRIAVHSAADDVRSLLTSARTLALAGHSSVAVDIDSATGILRIRRGSEVLMSRSVVEAHGVGLGRTRDSLAYDPHGLGHGAANLSIQLRRRAAAETVFVSRFGRVR
jgi:prepilin-type N-terminal cleavage/methylation domain-containing protein